MTIFLSFWILPIAFILHDFEEMIMVPLWKRHHAAALAEMKKPYFGGVTNGQAFSAGVLEEMVILVLVSALSGITHNTTLYLAFVFAYSFHFLMHIRMCIAFKRYVPGIVTALVQAPLMIWLFAVLWGRSGITLGHFAVYGVPAFLFMIVNLKMMHKVMPVIQVKMTAYSHKPLA